MIGRARGKNKQVCFRAGGRLGWGVGVLNLPPLILASASPRRGALLGEIVAGFELVASGATECVAGHWSPEELCQLNAYSKARLVAQRFPEALVLGADTLVFLEGEVFGKPANLARAQQMLARLQGRTHVVVTGVSLIHWRARRERIFAVGTAVRFRALTAAQVRDYLARINPLDKAGGYAIQEHGELIVEEITGSYSNVVGLPVERVRAELAAWG